jgi:hypothetical protein
MTGIVLLKQLSFTRIYTLGRLQQSMEGEWDTQPAGFNNTIRWNAGHTFVSMETLVQKAVPDYKPVNAEWIPLFKPGSSPTDWEVEPPSNEKLLTALQEQPERILSVLQGKLSNSLTEPMHLGKMHTMETVEAIVQFAVWHEGIHSGVIHALNRMTGE